MTERWLPLSRDSPRMKGCVDKWASAAAIARAPCSPSGACINNTRSFIGRCWVPEKMCRRPSSLLVFADDWGRHPSSCQHLIRHTLGRYDVYWVNTIGTRTPRLDWATLTRGLEKAR